MSSPVKDPLGARMKDSYESRTRTYLPRRTYAVIRLDGRGFSTYTRGLPKPFDPELLEHMVQVTERLCGEVAGTVLGYTQSDEISLILCDFATPTTQAWFDGNVQKIVSTSAAFASVVFNELRPGRLATFDSRVFTIPDPVELANYLLWRQFDAARNSVSMLAQSRFSAKQLHGRSTAEMKSTMEDIGDPWEAYPEAFKWGVTLFPETVIGDVHFERRDGTTGVAQGVERKVWTRGTPWFAKTGWLNDRIPPMPSL